MAEADAWRAKELAKHGKDPQYAAAIEARYQIYRDAFLRPPADGPSLRNTAPLANWTPVTTDSVSANVTSAAGEAIGSRLVEHSPTSVAASFQRILSQLGLNPLQLFKQMAPFAAVEAEVIVGRGSNSRAFEDPMTLEQAVPELRNALGNAVIAVSDNLLDLTGPATAFKAQFLQDQTKQITAQIKALDPNWHYDELGPTDAFGTPIATVQGLQAKFDDLRIQRAAVVARVKGDYGPLQVETLRFVQQRVDNAYDDGVALLKAGRLIPRLSNQEAVGNYVDREVRRDLRVRYSQLGIDPSGKGPVRVNPREYDSLGTNLTYRRPDARVNDVAFDVSLTQKTLGTPQIRGFFNTDFQPRRVIIIRPRQLGADHTYVIPHPETKR